MARIRQPQGPVRIAPQYSGGSAAIHTTILAQNLVTGKWPTLYGQTNAPSISTGPGGIALVAATGNYSKTAQYDGSRFTTNFTVIVCASVPDLSAVHSLIDQDAYPNTRKYQFRTETDGRILAVPFNSGGSPASVYSTNAVMANVPFVAAMRYADTTDVWLNGIGGTPGAVSGGVTTATSTITIGAGQSGSLYDDCVDGGAYIYGWVIVPRLLSDAELRSITQSPAAFWGGAFQPQRRPWIQLGAAAGGPAIYNDSVSESGSAADTPSALGLYVGAHSETATALDVKSAVTSAVAAAAETASAADTQTAIATLVATAAETASAVDTTSATSTSSGTAEAAEAATAVDAPSAIATLLATGAEIASALDTATSIYSTAATVAESASGAESTDGTVIPVGASLCVETASAADTVTCVIVTAGSIAEGTASATDVCAAGGIWNDFVTETVTAVDTQSSIEPISAIPPDVSRRIDNSTVRVGSSKIDRGSTRLG